MLNLSAYFFDKENEMQKKHYEQLIAECEGIKLTIKELPATHWRPAGTYNTHIWQEGDIKVPDNVYIKIVSSATKGTIGKLVDIEPSTKYYSDGEISRSNGTYILEVEGRNQLVRISNYYSNILENYTGETKYVRNVTKHNKPKLKNPITKYKQELNIGDWVFGAVGRSIRVGRVTRYTAKTVWGTMSDDLNDRQKEFKFEGTGEIFKIDNVDAIKEQLTFATLKGWKGK